MTSHHYRMCHLWVMIWMLMFCFLSPTSSLLAAKMDRGIGVTVKTREGKAKQIELYSDYYALVIGSGAYNKGWPSLPNPVKDAKEVAASLKRLGWTVDLVEDPDSDQLKRKLNNLIVDIGKEKNRAILIWFPAMVTPCRRLTELNLGISSRLTRLILKSTKQAS